MTELAAGTGAESLYVCITRTCIENRFEINRKHILMADLIVVHFYIPYGQTVDRWQTSPANCN